MKNVLKICLLVIFLAIVWNFFGNKIFQSKILQDGRISFTLDGKKYIMTGFQFTIRVDPISDFMLNYVQSGGDPTNTVKIVEGQNVPFEFILGPTEAKKSEISKAEQNFSRQEDNGEDFERIGFYDFLARWSAQTSDLKRFLKSEINYQSPELTRLDFETYEGELKQETPFKFFIAIPDYDLNCGSSYIAKPEGCYIQTTNIEDDRISGQFWGNFYGLPKGYLTKKKYKNQRPPVFKISDGRFDLPLIKKFKFEK